MRSTLLSGIRLFFIALGGFVAMGLLLGLGLSMVGAYEYHFGFNRQRWLTGGRTGTFGINNPRASMADDVMAHYLKPGMTRAEVVALLGSPDRDGIEMVVPSNVSLPDSLGGENGHLNIAGFNEWHRLNAQPDTLMHYWVGWDMIDPTSMRVEFDGTGKVKRYWVGLH
ncbi:hypothetical protein [Hymenobacter cheonanensis]|uniref:hypothetical protein n=1 Tax=Hymenobacter sp. CA2-7 TaxID=3063993 RepID=UPI00271229FC|nr:hypothetical protein [Hymenobacter sp. CA2-7]MDO7884291.1 hypothetical protein [Hymenobacter sp. CA2-7]